MSHRQHDNNRITRAAAAAATICTVVAALTLASAASATSLTRGHGTKPLGKQPAASHDVHAAQLDSPQRPTTTPIAKTRWAPHLKRDIVPLRRESLGRQLATWYGPGFFGHRTACGTTLTPATWGIAHRSLPCGTLVEISHAGRSVVVPVVDRGPYSGADIDLTSRTKEYLHFVDGTVRMQEVTRWRTAVIREQGLLSRAVTVTHG